MTPHVKFIFLASFLCILPSLCYDRIYKSQKKQDLEDTTMTAEEMWQEFCQKKNIQNKTYEAWAFCGGGPAADELAQLVLAGEKTATASAYDCYLSEGEALPKPGDYSVILYDNGDAACILKDYDVSVVPFDEVPAYHAYLEGEQGRSLETWREIHKRAFAPDFESLGQTLTGQSKIVLEKFELVYAPQLEKEEELMLIEPLEKYSDEISAYRQEFLDNGDSMDGCGSLRRQENPADWIAHSRSLANPTTKLDNWVHATQLVCVRKSDQRIVGMIQVRHSMNDYIRNYAGHIGYSVRPSERKKGYAAWMLKNVLGYCKALGIDEVLVTCLDTNEASRRTILANHGVYQNTIHEPEEKVNLERYIISI